MTADQFTACSSADYVTRCSCQSDQVCGICDASDRAQPAAYVPPTAAEYIAQLDKETATMTTHTDTCNLSCDGACLDSAPSYFDAVEAHIARITPEHRAAFQGEPQYGYEPGTHVWVMDHYNTGRILSPSVGDSWVVELTDADGAHMRFTYDAADLRPASAPVEFRWPATASDPPPPEPSEPSLRQFVAQAQHHASLALAIAAGWSREEVEAAVQLGVLRWVDAQGHLEVA